jgi:hypothetical protein
MEKANLIEGKRRGIGESKIWRLAKKGRKMMEVEEKAKPFNVREVDHILGIGNCFLHLSFTGQLQYFETELREVYTANGKKKKFCPDAFFIYKGKPYLLEYQSSPITSTRWGEKWAVYSEYFEDGHFHNASWQRFGKSKQIKPMIIVISTQQKQTILSGSKNTINILSNIEMLLS